MFFINNKYIMTVLVSLSIWIVANTTNTMLFAFVFAFASNSGLGGIGFVSLCSALFSLPGILIFWVVFIITCRKDNAFVIFLMTAASVSFLSVVLFFLYLVISFGADRGMWIFIIPVFCAVAATAIHRRAINNVVFANNEIYQSNNSDALET